ncbi:amidase 1-like [Vicia villosa]|uniref:amidase 1-like n=1 Tax=Vicia villosa TaxID=3911 RepID=UPI00273CF27C|nr:amidase 1-like [Vicia villosa]
MKLVVYKAATYLIGKVGRTQAPRETHVKHNEDQIPGGSSSGSAVAGGAKIVDFSLGIDTAGSARMPTSYCGIFRTDTAAGTDIASEIVESLFSELIFLFSYSHLGCVLGIQRLLLQSPQVTPVRPTQVVIFHILSSKQYKTADDVIRHEILGDYYVKPKVPGLKHFMSEENTNQVYNIPSLAALSSAMRLLQRYEFKNNHGGWIDAAVKPDLGSRISELVSDAFKHNRGAY